MACDLLWVDPSLPVVFPTLWDDLRQVWRCLTWTPEWVNVVQGTASGRLDTYYGAGRLGGNPGHLMKTIIPKAEDTTASVSVQPVREPPASSQAPLQPQFFVGYSYNNHSCSSASSGKPCLNPVSLHNVMLHNVISPLPFKSFMRALL